MLKYKNKKLFYSFTHRLILPLTLQHFHNTSPYIMAQLNFTALPLTDPLEETVSKQYIGSDVEWPVSCDLTQEQRSLLGFASNFIGLMDTPAKVIEHLDIVKSMNAAQPTTPASVAAKTLVRGQKNAAVAAAHAAWKAAVEKRRTVVQELDKEVRALHTAYNNARDA